MPSTDTPGPSSSVEKREPIAVISPVMGVSEKETARPPGPEDVMVVEIPGPGGSNNTPMTRDAEAGAGSEAKEAPTPRDANASGPDLVMVRLSDADALTSPGKSAETLTVAKPPSTGGEFWPANRPMSKAVSWPPPCVGTVGGAAPAWSATPAPNPDRKDPVFAASLETSA